MKSLREFALEELQRVTRFESWWKEQNAVNPEVFPLDTEDGDEGRWEEQLAAFEDTGPKVLVKLLPYQHEALKTLLAQAYPMPDFML